MFGTIPDNVRMPVVNELLVNEVSPTSDVTETYLTNDPNFVEVSKFINTFVLDSFKEYSQKVYNFKIQESDSKINAWTNNGTGRYSLGFHNHAGAQLSAVFYLLVDDQEGVGGKISFHDPRFNANRGVISAFRSKHNDYVYAPKTGDFIIFPSYLYHSTSTFFGQTRLIIPVDLFLKD
jgi:hypothetical protein